MADRSDALKSRIAKGKSGTLETEQGTLYVSQPYRSKSNSKLRALVAFAPRTSHFDLTNVASGRDEFRGFFTLFWISMFILSIRIYVITFEQMGESSFLSFASMFSRDATTLALSDAVLVGSTLLCVPFAKALHHGWIGYDHTGMILQHVFQTTLLAVAVTWTFNRQWPWVQSGFLTIHTLVMIMKVHSYISHNGHLSIISKEAVCVEHRLRESASLAGGWDQALQDAEKHRQSHRSEPTSTENTPNGTPLLIPEGASRSYYNGPTAAALRNRLLAATDSISNKMSDSGRTTTPPPVVPSNLPAHPLVDHPDPKISELANHLTELESELTSTGIERVRWPANVTWANYADYLLVPSLVYELEFPRTDRLRPFYLLEKTVATFGTFTLLYTVTAHAILPLTPTPEQSFLRSLLDLSLPFMLCYLLLFYLIFECICNGFAELSRFADRQFYEDWWNATSWDEFARKWNKPVHVFLLRHVYASAISSHKLSRGWASFWTFFLSAAVHEFVMAIVTKKLRMYLFVLQMIQLPLIALSRLPAIKRNKILGNTVFWLGLYAGFPLLCVAYCAY
ncbi:MBOAT, membrane-bound O-acyltransferase family-domain-containing protein [Gautieria morchelliformis]|nr:MBOAT, membrane-bound O-acyltransferase family-domain-containing protein [Gautieria morchelliformis]